MPVLAKHSKHFSLEDNLEIGGAHRKYLRTAKRQAAPLDEIAIVLMRAQRFTVWKASSLFRPGKQRQETRIFPNDPPVNCLSLSSCGI
jgi:hypothetical protein